jgi:thymidine phosphorylase
MVVRRMALDTHDQPVIITRRDCPVCRSEGFSAHARVRVEAGNRRIIATLYQIDSDLLSPGEAALSESAWHRLAVEDGDEIHLSHPQPLNSLGLVRGRIFGQPLSRPACRTSLPTLPPALLRHPHRHVPDRDGHPRS